MFLYYVAPVNPRNMDIFVPTLIKSLFRVCEVACREHPEYLVRGFIPILIGLSNIGSDKRVVRSP